jgi:hypothetical protein
LLSAPVTALAGGIYRGDLVLANRSAGSASYLAENGPGALRALFALGIITLITDAFIPAGIPTEDSSSDDDKQSVHDDFSVLVQQFVKG